MDQLHNYQPRADEGKERQDPSNPAEVASGAPHAAPPPEFHAQGSLRCTTSHGPAHPLPHPHHVPWPSVKSFPAYLCKAAGRLAPETHVVTWRSLCHRSVPIIILSRSNVPNVARGASRHSPIYLPALLSSTAKCSRPRLSCPASTPESVLSSLWVYHCYWESLLPCASNV